MGNNAYVNQYGFGIMVYFNKTILSTKKVAKYSRCVTGLKTELAAGITFMRYRHINNDARDGYIR